MKKAKVFFMITLTKGNNSENIYCTPLELLNAAPPLYYFKFVNRLTQDVVQCWLQNTSVTTRFQLFEIDTEALFGNYNEGFWTYTIQPASANNVVPITDICESGLLNLKPINDFTPIKYDEQTTTFKTYN